MTEQYKKATTNLAMAIDIAIAVFQEFPPFGWDSRTIGNVTNTYLEFKEATLNAAPQFCNMKSLQYKIQDVFTIFQEGSGDFADVFWERIYEAGLPYKRENKLAKILKRKKIKNRIEYDFVIDVMGPYIQKKLLTNEDVILLNQLIADFESKSR